MTVLILYVQNNICLDRDFILRIYFNSPFRNIPAIFGRILTDTLAGKLYYSIRVYESPTVFFPVLNEMVFHCDIVQFSVRDDYMNNTLKAVSMLKYVVDQARDGFTDDK